MHLRNETHIPQGAKKPLFGLRIAQLVIAIVILGLSSYGVYWLVYDGDALTLSAAVISIIICGYVIIASSLAPVMYNYWAILALDILAVVLWLSAFPTLAAQIATSVVYTSSYDTYYGAYYNYKIKRGLGIERRAETTWDTYKGTMIASSAFGALEFALFVATLIILSVQLHRHRKAGGHCVPGGAAPRRDDVESKRKRNAVATAESAQPEVRHAPVS
ncbi:hypothetical protein DSL72_007861 [Monilinia vaccinii-corymbosi]|uniref:MARVEL domain-containing protein n=1 Tax=Monilinia vaccinii-corymbosi TaxID=61207 RepID=A0A8A3PIY7_9HELO|nr:hypothetical protein DSL72_007861 [Monilinia vaccinii-corymbosi]